MSDEAALRRAERGLGVVLISHNMADVQAVADRIVVLRLGRNNGEFKVADVTYEDIIAAITGASDNAVTRRAQARVDAADVATASRPTATARPEDERP